MINTLMHTVEESLEQALQKVLDTDFPAGRYLTIETRLDNHFPVTPVEDLEHFFINKPDDQTCLLGLGEMMSIRASGTQRLESLKRQFKQLQDNWHYPASSAPLAFIAFAFDENDPMTGDWQNIPNTLLQFPRILIKTTPAGKFLQFNMTIHSARQENQLKDEFKNIKTLLNQYLSYQSATQPDVVPLNAEHRTSANSKIYKNNNTTENYHSTRSNNKQAWQKLSQEALDEIQKGHFDKLVTSRQQWVRLAQEVSLAKLTDKLSRYYPACTVLSFLSKGTRLVCASPERLIHLQDAVIKSEAIGGTILKSPQQDANPPRLLPTDQDNPEYHKLLKEHRFIAQDIYQHLDPLCHSLKMSCSPYLMKLHNMYHLETPIEGVLQEQYDVFDIIKALHPTPAIAGFPALQAQQWLLAHEGYQRGWYSGAFGWLDAQMNGELSVMLRCALLNSEQAHLYAGAGLIRESDPEIEWQETELKMQTILEML